jgi:uncharacterized flavoprotein (TIGR03862 family)
MTLLETAVLVIGGGPAGLAAAEVAASAGLSVRVIDQMPSVGRKLLIAGRGGLNLTHSEPDAAFRQRYGAAAPWLAPMLDAFGRDAVREWCHGLGIETYVGSSGRVFPIQHKASPLLRAWLARLQDLGVVIETRRRWHGFDGAGRVLVDGAPIAAPAVVLACGGASWPKLGSDGAWTAWLPVTPLSPSNAGIEIAWSPTLLGDAGAPVKPLRLSVGGAAVRGEAVVTAEGLEGGAVYALGAAIRAALAAGEASVTLDLLPDLDLAELVARWQASAPRDSTANRLRKAWGLTEVRARLLREPGPLPSDPAALAARARAVTLPIKGFRPIDRAISSAGGVPIAVLTDRLMLVDRPGVFCAGEMLDWDAPTGGYLLTACWSTGRWAGQGAVDWVRRR